MTVYDVIIIGAGASGLMASIHAATRGCRVLVIDHANSAGKKILLSGGGKCNITNRHVSTADYFGADHKFCKHALKSFTTASVIHLLQEARIATEEREHGRIFCKKGAHEIVTFLVRTAEQLDVHFLMNMKVSEVKHDDGSFFVQCTEPHVKTTHLLTKRSDKLFQAAHLLMATGGLACPQIGATDLGYRIARQFGHEIISIKPALAGFILPDSSPLRNLQGISLNVCIQIKGRGKVVEEPLLFTHQGISGPAVLQVSCFWEAGEVILINFLPADNIVLQMHNPINGKLQVKSLVARLLPERLAKALLPACLSERKVAEINRKDREIIAESIHSYPVTPDAVEGFTKAEATLGGVSTRELNPKSMESLLLKGLYFSGEVIDITGRLGGYNIHWAFASGYVAGQNMSKDNRVLNKTI